MSVVRLVHIDEIGIEHERIIAAVFRKGYAVAGHELIFEEVVIFPEMFRFPISEQAFRRAEEHGENDNE